MMHPEAVRTLARYTSQGLLNGLWQGTLLAAVVAAILKRNRTLNSSTRFLASFVLLLTIAALPLATARPIASAATAVGNSAALDLPETWSAIFFAAWGVISFLMLLRLAFGYLSLKRLVARSEPIQGPPADLLRELSQGQDSNISLVGPSALEPVYAVPACDIVGPGASPGLPSAASENAVPAGALARRGKISLRESCEISRPLTTGLLHPVVLLPMGLADSLDPQELRQVLLHELTHIRRYDNWTNLLQRIVSAIFFFYPAVWWIGRELSLQREIACDDAVVAASPRPRAYAQCLARLAESNWLRGYQLAQSAVGKLCQLTLRIGKILDGRRDVSSRISRPALAATALVTIVAVIGAAHLPPVVFFAPDAHLSARTAPAAPVILAKTPASVPAASKPLVVAAKARHREPLAVLARAQSPDEEARAIAAWLSDQGLRVQPASATVPNGTSVAIVQFDRVWVTKDGRLVVGRYVFVVHYPTSGTWGRVVKS